jgi:hypothetical protein
MANNYLAYKVLPELKIIVEYFEGQIYLKDLIEFQLNQLNDKTCKIEYSDITDLRNAEFIVKKDDLKHYVDFIKENEEKQGNRRIAIIADTPFQTALTMLYSSYTESLMLNNKVFSTEEAAFKWLEIPENKFKLIRTAFEQLSAKRR